MPFSPKRRSLKSWAVMPLQQKLLLTFLPIVLLPLAIAGTWSGIVTYQRTLAQAELRLRNQARLTAVLTHKELERKMTMLGIAARDPIVVEAARKGTQTAEKTKLASLEVDQAEALFQLDRAKKVDSLPKVVPHLRSLLTLGDFPELFLTERNGLNLADTEAPNDFVQRDELWWQIAKDQEQWVGAPQLKASTQKTVIEIAKAVIDPKSGEFLGVLKASYDVVQLKHLKGELENLQLTDTEQVQIVAIAGHATPVFTLTPQTVFDTQKILGGKAIMSHLYATIKAAVNDEPTAEEEFEIQTDKIEIGDRWYMIAKVPDSSWVTIASIDLASVRAASFQVISGYALVFLGLAAIATIVILRISQRFAAPLNQLSQVAQDVTEQADFTVRVPEHLPDRETRVLATSFNQLIQRVQLLLTEQEQAKQQLEDYNHTLETQVNARTQELNEKAQRLEETLQELKSTQAQIVQAEKMSSLGQLVAGIAHEINNPVNFIHGNVGHVRENVQDLLDLIALYQAATAQPKAEIVDKIEEIDLEFLREDLPKLLGSMRIGTERIREIVKSLRIFSRLDEADVKAIDLHEGIDSTLMILQNRLKVKSDRMEIKVIKDYAELPLVECYAGQLNQVFMNLFVNAIDALEEVLEKNPTHQPHIKIATKRLNEDWLEIAIADNGSGIPESVQQRIFDPFFTTKPVGKGTGMGMSISYQIVTEKHGGRLEFVSTPGQGTHFSIQIPIVQASTPRVVAQVNA